MDAFVQLALIEKAKRVFTTDPSIMLSFPLLTPLSFTAAELAGLVAPSTPADYTAAADFARMVNFLPRDIVANASERMLWDIYRDVLARAEVALSSPAELASSGDTSILYQVIADGGRIESEVLKQYRQYRDAWFVARENYAARKLTGELSEDPEVRRNWNEVEEPQLRTALDTATREWEELGRREEIELALQAERATALNTPGVRWAEWKDAFNPDIDMLSDAWGNQYAPTGLSPRNFAKQDNWLSFNLSASEIKALVDEAPEALKVVLDDNQGSNIERVSFEYRSVALVRPWFRPEALISRIWRSTDPNLMLSDGTDPPSGSCPAYAAACVFVRNIVIVEKGGISEGQSLRNLRFTVDPKRLTYRDLRLDPAIVARVTRRETGVTPTPPPPDARSLRAFRTLERDSFVLAPQLRAEPVAIGAMTARATPSQLHHVAINTSVRVQSDLQRHMVLDPDRHIPIVEALRPEVSGTEVSEAPSLPPPRNDDDFSILAFICKRLPKTPDPAPGLNWG